MNITYLLPPLIAFILGLVLSFIVLRSNYRNTTHQIFAGFLLSIGMWGFVIFGMRSSPDLQHALPWDRAVTPLAATAVVLYLHFTVKYTNVRFPKQLIWIAYLSLLLVYAIAPTSLLVSSMQLKPYGYAPVAGPLLVPTVLLQYTLFILAGVNLLRGYRNSITYEERNRLTYLLIAVLLFFLFSPLDLLPLLGLRVYPGAIIGNILFSSLTAFTILKYNLLDIRIVIRKGTTYAIMSAIVAAFYSCIIFGFAQLFNGERSTPWLYLGLIIALAFGLQPLWQRVQRFVDRRFYRDTYNYLKALETFSWQSQSLLDPESLISHMLNLFAKALRVSSICLLLPYTEDNNFVVAGSIGMGTPAQSFVLKRQSPLVSWLGRSDNILSERDFDIVPMLQSLNLAEREQLKKVHAELIAPMRTRLGYLSGVLILGVKLSQQPYTIEDKQLIRTICNQMSTNLENIQLYNESQQEVIERKQAEEKLQTILKTALDGFWINNLEGKILEVNDSYCKMTGYTCQELLTMSVSDLDAIETPRKVAQRIKKLIKQGYDRFESQHRRKDGSIIDVEVSINYLDVGEGQFFVFARDITDRKLAEKTLQESEEKLRQTFDSATDGISVINLKGIVNEVNQRTVEMHRFSSREELLGKSAFELVAPRDHERMAKNMQRALKQGATRSVEYTLLRADGSEFPAELSTSVLKDASGNLIGHVSIARDITERKQAEAREKELQRELYLSSRLASIGELAAGVAHQLNNPLTGVLGFSQRLMRKSTTLEANKDLKRIYSEAERAAKIVQNLLTFARQRQPHKQYSDINRILESALELRAYELKTANVELATNLAPEFPKTMLDYHQIQEVFLNIILNAEQAMTTTNGGGKLTIKTEKNKRYVRAIITDNGPGITPEHLDKIFDPFYTTKGEKGGTGLGLSICHGIVTEHGGNIYAKSKLGEGTAFFVELPIKAEE